MAAKVLQIYAVTDSRKGVSGFRQMETAADRFSRRVNRASVVAGAGLLALGKATLDAGRAAAADAKDQALLATSLKKSAGASRKSIAATEAWIDRQSRAKGIADDQLRPALATLVRSTRDVEKSQQALALAMDVSAATGKPLGTVSAALAKGYGGNTAALGRLIPGLDKAVLKTGDMSKITGELSKMMGGTAADAAKTEQGKLDRATVSINEMQEKIGKFALPMLGQLAEKTRTAAEWAEDHSRTVKIVASVVGGLAAAIILLNGVYRAYQAALVAVQVVQKAGVLVTGIQTAAQYALGTAWLVGRVAALAFAGGMKLVNKVVRANALGLIITAITIVAGLLVLAFRKSSTFRSIVQATGRAGSTALGWIVSKVTSLVGWLRDKLGPVAGKVKRVVVGAFDAWLSPLRTVVGIIKDIVSWIGKIKIPKGLTSLGGLLGGGPPSGPSTPSAPGGGSAAGGRGGPGGPDWFVSGGGGRRAFGNTYITIQGAIDPVRTAKQIKELLAGDSARNATA